MMFWVRVVGDCPSLFDIWIRVPCDTRLVPPRVPIPSSCVPVDWTYPVPPRV